MIDYILRYLRQKAVSKSIPKNSIVCDIGCGADASFLKKISGVISFGFGFDKNVNFYKNSKIELNNIDLETDRLPLDDGSIGTVTMLAVLEHLKEPQNIFLEIFRILKPEGFLIITTPAPLAKPILEFFAFNLKLINQREIKDHKRYLKPSEITNLLLKSGFKEDKVKIKKFEFGLNILATARK